MMAFGRHMPNLSRQRPSLPPKPLHPQFEVLAAGELRMGLEGRLAQTQWRVQAAEHDRMAKPELRF